MSGRLVGLVLLVALVCPWAPVAVAAQPPAVAEQVTPVRPMPVPADVELRVGQTATLDGGDLQIRFVGVDEDDRCPREVECEWPGRAVVRLRVAVDHQDRGEVMVALYAAPQPPADLQSDALAVVDRYAISLVDFQPYPVFSQPISPDQRVATLRVTAP